MKVNFFTALLNVELSPISGRGDQLFDGLYITTDKSILQELIDSEVGAALGHLEVEALRNAPAIIYSREDINEDSFEWWSYLKSRIVAVKAFFNVVWLFTDNALDCELGFLLYNRGSDLKVHSNLLGIIYSKADLTRTAINMTRKELQEIRAYSRVVFQKIGAQPQLENAYRSKDTSRLTRALSWIHQARSAYGLEERIACYCTAMESLFATSTTELAHQLAERMAVFLTDAKDERLQIYREIKRAYGVRSKVVHGDILKQSKLSEVPEVSMISDDLLRRAIRKAIDDQSSHEALRGTNENLDQYFLSALFASGSNFGVADSE